MPEHTWWCWLGTLWTARKGRRDGLLGFAVQREQLGADGGVVERYWMTGIKRFREKDRGLAPGTPVSTAEHPFQGFQWADYTAETGHRYRYRVLPAYGVVKRIELDEDAAARAGVEIATEREYLLDPTAANDHERHDVYFNRGVIGSQAYARRFGNRKPKADSPTSPEMVWLSRGLFEALVRFIGLAEDHRFALRAALYEFHYQPVANAFAKAVEAGADVKIVYDAHSSYKAQNEAVIHRRKARRERWRSSPHGEARASATTSSSSSCATASPRQVWTGSTNVTEGGIFGHANVGHIVWSATVAEDPEYWNSALRQPDAGQAAA